MQSTDVLLDIGIGSGDISLALANRVRCVIGTGLNFASYGARFVDLYPHRIIPVESVCESLPFRPNAFDVVIMSHILEHVPNVGSALHEASRVLRENGLLCVFVPPSEPVVAGGHISVGWNIGQLMYVLALQGFDTGHGNFVKYGYNICAFVRKVDRPLPELRHDFGDLKILAEAGRWPVPLTNVDPRREAFYGDLIALNWPWTDMILQPKPGARGHGLIGRLLRLFTPKRLRPWISRILLRLAGAFMVGATTKEREVINPQTLSS